MNRSIWNAKKAMRAAKFILDANIKAVEMKMTGVPSFYISAFLESTESQVILIMNQSQCYDAAAKTITVNKNDNSSTSESIRIEVEGAIDSANSK